MLLVSFDPEHDTPEQLAGVVEKQKVDSSRWKLARADYGDVRKLAAVLGIRFRKLPDVEFNHTSVITLLNSDGVPIINSTKLAHADPDLVASLRSLLQ